MSGIDDRLAGLLATIEARQTARLNGSGPVDEWTDPDRMKASAVRWLQRERELRQSIRGHVTCLRMAQGNRRAAVRLANATQQEAQAIWLPVHHKERCRAEFAAVLTGIVRKDQKDAD